MFEEFSDYAASVGADLSVMTPSQRQVLETTWRATHRDDIVARHAARNPYQTDEVRNKVENAFVAGATPRQMDLVGLRAARPGSPAVYESSRGPGEAEVLEASLLGTMGESDDGIAKHYGARVADAATSKRFRGVTLHGLIRHQLAKQGRDIGPGRLSESTIRDAFTFSASVSGNSTYTIPTILSNAANKRMLAVFNETGTAWRQFCKRSSVSDFKSATGLRLVGNDILAQVPPGGTVSHGSLKELTYTNQAATYGQLLGIDRRDIINDDMGVLQSIPAPGPARGNHD